MHGIVDDWNTGSVWEMLREVPADRSHSTFKRPAFILFSTDSREPPRKLHRETDACEFRQLTLIIVLKLMTEEEEIK